MIISAPRLFVDGAFTGPGAIAIENGLIARIYPEIPPHVDLTLRHGSLTPGLIDIHNNGAFGVDFCTATPAEFDAVMAKLAAHGVTSVLPTIITAPLAAMHESAARIAAAMATHGGILGVHAEGPFLSPEKRGAHEAAWLLAPDAGIASLPGLCLVTLAPELTGALDVIRGLAQAGILVSLGHTNANAAQMRDAAAAGATLVTHVFNAQSPLGHREPAAPVVALTDDRLSPCLIADGLHVDPAILHLAFAACPRAIAVTDSILLAGLPPGTAREFGGAAAILGPDNLARRADGTIAGAAITLDQGIRRLIAAGIAPETAIAAATSRPADALHLADRGRIAPGQRADLIWWDDQFHIQQVWTGTGAPITAAPRTTETPRREFLRLETEPTRKIVQIFLEQERAAQAALAHCTAAIAELAEAIAQTLQNGGRLFYAGAGTSGRLGLLDAVECGPTFGIETGIIIPLLAGGDQAFLKAVEGAEDDTQTIVETLTTENFSSADILIGIAASGTTPFTLAAITHANKIGALTGSITNNPNSPIALAAKIAIEINSGPEIIAGSTRLSAGTTQKIALNILSSTAMIKLGKTRGPYMIDVRATNKKLRVRAVRITAAIANVPETQAAATLATCGYDIKAALQILTGAENDPTTRR
jgi:N-acetylmuramic acid 6-phosphate etherase/N-acetylglucosamine-6-phosphate deacetylase